jgi:hypothetical protein
LQRERVGVRVHFLMDEGAFLIKVVFSLAQGEKVRVI